MVYYTSVVKCHTIVIYGISGLFKILPTRSICNLRGLARIGYYLVWVVLNNARMPYNVLSKIPKFLDNNVINESLLPMGYVCYYNPRCYWQQTSYRLVSLIKTN
jgi:hypothetical protein